MLDNLRRGKKGDPAPAIVEQPAYDQDVDIDAGYGVDTRSNRAKYLTVFVAGIAYALL